MDDIEKKKLQAELKADEVHVHPLIDGAINSIDVDKDGIKDIPFLIHQAKLVHKAIKPYEPVVKALLPLVQAALPHVEIKAVLADVERWILETKAIGEKGKPSVIAIFKVAKPMIEKAFADLVASLAAVK